MLWLCWNDLKIKGVWVNYVIIKDIQIRSSFSMLWKCTLQDFMLWKCTLQDCFSLHTWLLQNPIIIPFTVHFWRIRLQYNYYGLGGKHADFVFQFLDILCFPYRPRLYIRFVFSQSCSCYRHTLIKGQYLHRRPLLL